MYVYIYIIRIYFLRNCILNRRYYSSQLCQFDWFCRFTFYSDSNVKEGVDAWIFQI